MIDQIEVFKYAWIYYDHSIDRPVAKTSEEYYTPESFNDLNAMLIKLPGGNIPRTLTIEAKWVNPEDLENGHTVAKKAEAPQPTKAPTPAKKKKV